MLNLDYLKQITGHDKVLMDTLLSQFLNTTESDIINLNKAIQQNMPSDIKSIAHRIKGAATTVGASELRDLVTELEHSEEKNTEYYTDIFNKIQHSFQAIVSKINAS